MGAEGTLLQLDGSRHRWLEERGPELVLVGAIDDATGLVTGAVFRDQEDAAGYLEILSATILAYGLPGAIYRDGHSAFAPSSPARRHPLADDDPALSQVGRALVELDIDSILAGSPQAKGRIERLWGTFQDRLVVELRLAGVADRASANAFLVDYLARHNARFVVPAVDPVPAWRALPDDVRLERVLVFKYRRKVARDHTVSLDGRILQLPRGATGAANYAGKRVEVHVALDGSIVAYDGERRLAVYRDRVAAAADLPAIVAVAREALGEDAHAGVITVLSQMVAGAHGRPELGRRLAASFSPWIDLVEEAVTRILGGTPFASALPAREVATALTGMFVGVELLSQLDPEAGQVEALLASIDAAAGLLQSLLTLLGGGAPDQGGSPQ